MATHAVHGRPQSPLVAEVMRLARDSAPRAVRRLLYIMDNAEPRESIAAAALVLSYGVGKPREAVLDPSEMSDADLLAEVSRRERVAAGARRVEESALDS